MQVKKIVAVAAATGGLVLAGAGVASAHGAQAEGAAWNSPGVVSGNTISVIGLLNPAFGNSCQNF